MNATFHHSTSVKGRSIGFTLVELLVTIIITLIIVMLAVAVLTNTRQGFAANDSASQLQDSARFGMYILRRLAQQAGYEDYATKPDGSAGLSRAVDAKNNPNVVAGLPICAAADVCGWDNQRPNDAGTRAADAVLAGTATQPGAVVGDNGFQTDTLVLRFQGADGSVPGVADGSIIDCGGFAQGAPVGATAAGSRSISVLYIHAGVGGEPELRCAYMGNAGTGNTMPLIRGVESFQVLYGVDLNSDGVHDQFVRADQMATLAVTSAATMTNPQGENPVLNIWRNVRALRIGMVIRGEVGSAAQYQNPITLFPLGQDVASAADSGSIFVAPNDRRLRRVVTMTLQIRNDLTLPAI
jgi:type IV pilus assembly protein PilW